MVFKANSRLFLTLSITVVIFIISVLVRLDNLKEPLGKHHEWLTGHVLGTVSVYEKNSASEHYFAPVWTFSAEADRYAASLTEFKDKNNYTYYVSYPPLCFLLPHFLFKLCFTHASVGGIRTIGLIVQFFTAFFVLLIIYRVFNKSIRQYFFLPAFAGYILYVFASGNLWFHANVFFADTLVPLFIASFIYVFIGVCKGDFSVKKSALLLFIPCFLGAYTEWQMLFVSFLACAFFFLAGFKRRQFFIYFLSISLSTLIALGLTYYQYSSIAGSDKLIEVQKAKYKQRSGADHESAEAGYSMKNSFSFANIAQHYEKNYNVLLDFGWYCFLLLAVLMLLDKIAVDKFIDYRFLAVLLGLLLTILLHHYIFFNFTAVHDFSSVKLSLFISLLSAYVIGVLHEKAGDLSTFSGKAVVSLIALSLILFFHFSLNKYYEVNNPEELIKGHEISGNVIHRHVKDNELAFSDFINTPETTWYAKRNMITVPNLADAVSILNFYKYKGNGAFLHMGAKDMTLIKFNAKGDTLEKTILNY